MSMNPNPLPVSPVLVLASASPRRSELLRQIGVPHRVAVAGIAEERRDGEAVVDCVRRLALQKARHVWDLEQAIAPADRQIAAMAQLPVLGADTEVVLEGELLGKPADRAAALAMLARLAGRTHRVLSAVALVTRAGADVRLCVSEVEFRGIDVAEASAYWNSGEPRDKAGGYAIQGHGAVFVSALRGSYSGVMGLPLFETAALLDAARVPRWQGAL